MYKLKGLKQSKKAVSPVIAIILLIAITVAAAVTVFAYTQGIIGGFTRANLVLANAEIVDSTHVKFTFQNTGGSDLTIIRIDQEQNGATVDTGEITNAITGELIDDDGGLGYDTDLTISAGESVSIIIGRYDAGTWTSGDIITVQIWLTGNTSSSNPNYEIDFELQ
ncbi:MAG: archaellin/type IV pilin N-terminal domain-containing protein [Promethearchaeota archaeon]